MLKGGDSAGYILYYGLTDSFDTDSTLKTFPANDTLSFDLPAGDYSYYIKDEQNCQSATGTFILDEPDSLIISSITATAPLCALDQNGTITITATGGIPSSGEYTYYIKENPSEPYLDSIVGVSAVATFTGKSAALLQSKTYYIQVKDAIKSDKGCPVETTVIMQPYRDSLTLEIDQNHPAFMRWRYRRDDCLYSK